jgi:uncharacterized protein
MAKYRGKYILEGLGAISSDMERDLDIAYEICMSYKADFPCELCGRCCYQSHIIVQPQEVDRISNAANIPLYDFMKNYLVQKSDGRLLLKKTAPCAFLGKDNRCTIWEDRPEICDDFPYAVSLFMSRVYLAIIQDDVEILDLIEYMDDTWPCTKAIRSTITEKVQDAKEKRAINCGHK